MPRKKKEPTTQQAQQVTEPAPGGPDPERAGRAVDLSNEYFKLPEDEQDRIWAAMGQSMTDAIMSGTDWNQIIQKLGEIANGQLLGVAHELGRTAAEYIPKMEQGHVMEDAVKAAGKAAAPIKTIPLFAPMFDTVHDLTATTQRLMKFAASEQVRQAVEFYKAVMPFYREAIKERPRGENEDLADYQRERIQDAERRARDAGALPEEEPTGDDSGELSGLPENLKAIITRTLYMPNSKITEALFSDLTAEMMKEAEPQGRIIANKRKHNQVTTTLVVDIDPAAVKILSDKPFTRFDNAIHDTVASVYRQAREDGKVPIITAESIYQAWKPGGKLSPQMESKIMESLAKMRKTPIEIDATQEAVYRKLKDENGDKVKSWTISDYMLQLRKHKIITERGRKIDAYIVTAEPPLMEYARQTKQYVKVPAHMLTITDSTGAQIPLTDGRMAMLYYLCRRVASMKKDEWGAQKKLEKYEAKQKEKPDLPDKSIDEFRDIQRTISFDTLFKETQQDTANRVIKRRNRDYVISVLDHWRTCADISGYKLRKKGQEITAVELIL